MEPITIYEQTDSIYADAERIVDVTQKQAFHAVDRLLILRNWLLGKRIFEEELKKTFEVLDNNDKYKK